MVVMTTLLWIFLPSFRHFLIRDRWKWGRGRNKQKERQMEHIPDVKQGSECGMNSCACFSLSWQLSLYSCFALWASDLGWGVKQCWRRMKSTFSSAILTKRYQVDSCCLFSLQAHLSFMRYISVCCVVGIIAGFCIGPGKLIYSMLKDKLHSLTQLLWGCRPC